ncbi:MAG: hypothetical protein QNK24_00405, partial [Desulfuromusa sp.]|nr:hypothetical protein [Desulfuromusa sp.]
MMTTKYQKIMRVCQVAGGFMLLAGLLFAARNQTESAAVSEECIRCHVSVYQQGTENSQVHMPFWERQCVVCHLAEGSAWSAVSSMAADKTITGTVTNQEELWRKLQTYSASAGPVFDQLIDIPSLAMNTAYRFQIVTSPQAKNAGGEIHKSLWLGLQPNEMADQSSAKQFELSSGLSTSIGTFVKAATLSRNGNRIIIAWQTTQPLYGWIELQELEGLSLAELTPDTTSFSALSENQNQHPTLRDPEDLAINACYQCHPKSTLGTSHPVRLYGGKDVRIPDDLPTVEGMLTCVTCHNPHGSAGKMLVRETIKTK